MEMSFAQLCGGDSVSSTSFSDSERDVVHTAFSVTTATHDIGGIKGGDQPMSLLLLE